MIALNGLNVDIRSVEGGGEDRKIPGILRKTFSTAEELETYKRSSSDFFTIREQGSHEKKPLLSIFE